VGRRAGVTHKSIYARPELCYEGYYEASDGGQVKSVERVVPFGRGLKAYKRCRSAFLPSGPMLKACALANART
jgi:hypothetical protein